MSAAIWEPHIPVVGRRYRVRVSPECQVLNREGKPHSESVGNRQGSIVEVVHAFREEDPKFPGHRFLVVSPGGGWFSDARLAAAIELEPLEDEEVAL